MKSATGPLRLHVHESLKGGRGEQAGLGQGPWGYSLMHCASSALGLSPTVVATTAPSEQKAMSLLGLDKEKSLYCRQVRTALVRGLGVQVY